MASTTNEIDAEGEETVATPEATDTGMDENVAGALSYLLGLVTGIVFYVIDDREFVRFHAAQSIAFFTRSGTRPWSWPRPQRKRAVTVSEQAIDGATEVVTQGIDAYVATGEPLL